MPPSHGELHPHAHPSSMSHGKPDLPSHSISHHSRKYGRSERPKSYKGDDSDDGSGNDIDPSNFYPPPEHSSRQRSCKKCKVGGREGGGREGGKEGGRKGGRERVGGRDRGEIEIGWEEGREVGRKKRREKEYGRGREDDCVHFVCAPQLVQISNNTCIHGNLFLLKSPPPPPPSSPASLHRACIDNTKSCIDRTWSSKKTCEPLAVRERGWRSTTRGYEAISREPTHRPQTTPMHR